MFAGLFSVHTGCVQVATNDVPHICGAYYLHRIRRELVTDDFEAGNIFGKVKKKLSSESTSR